MAVSHWPGLFTENFQSQNVQAEGAWCPAVPSAQCRQVGIPQGAQQHRWTWLLLLPPFCTAQGQTHSLAHPCFPSFLEKEQLMVRNSAARGVVLLRRAGSEQRARRQNPKSFLSSALSILEQQSQGGWESCGGLEGGIAALPCNAHCHVALTTAATSAGANAVTATPP